MTFQLTDEQLAAVQAVKTAGSVAIEALAGAGKTSTLVAVAEALSDKRGMYVSFNKAIALEAAEKFTLGNVECRTAHSLAFGSVGRKYARRLKSRRMKGTEIARVLGIHDAIVVDSDEDTFEIHRADAASHVIQAINRFCMSGDDEVSVRHFPRREALDKPGQWAGNNDLAEKCLPYAQAAWNDICDLQGQLKFEHNYYLKIWALGRPAIDADFLMVDEAQDLNPAMASIVDYNRDRLQIIVVCDSYQAIYGWNGAVDYLGQNEFEVRTSLTRSFRFGPEIAAAANAVLARLECPMRVEGAGQPGSVGPVPDSATFLARTNASVLSHALALIDKGLRPHIVGGADELISFCYGVLDLQDGKRARHPDLAAFGSWDEVVQYVDNDEMGADLRTLVKIVEDFGARRLVSVLSNLPKEEDADAICSTAHKSKGREWDYVRLGNDFPVGSGVGKDELKLLYVAVTRAMKGVDVDGVDIDGVLAKPERPKGEPRSAALKRPVEWGVDCGYCGAVEGSPCRTRTGGDLRMDYIHIDRSDRFAASQTARVEVTA